MANGEFENVQYVSPKRPRRKFNKKLLLLLLIPALLAAAYLGAGELGYYYYIQRYGATAPKDAEIFCDPIVTAPGELNVYAHYVNAWIPGEFEACIKLEPGVEVPAVYGAPTGTSARYAIPIQLYLPEGEWHDAAITFDFSLSGGQFTRLLQFQMPYGEREYGPGYLGQEFTLENHQTIYWHQHKYDVENWEEEYDEEMILQTFIHGSEVTGYSLPEYSRFDGEKAYADIMIRADGHIIGCATLLFYVVEYEGAFNPDLYCGPIFYPMLIDSVTFPKQDGRYQLVTEEDVQGYFAQWKQESEHSAQ